MVDKCIQHSLKQDTPKCTPIKGQESKLHHPAPADPAQSDQSESQPGATTAASTSTATPECGRQGTSPLLRSAPCPCSRDAHAAVQTQTPCPLQGASNRLSSTSPPTGSLPDPPRLAAWDPRGNAAGKESPACFMLSFLISSSLVTQPGHLTLESVCEVFLG